jgi:hypothetical protein
VGLRNQGTQRPTKKKEDLTMGQKKRAGPQAKSKVARGTKTESGKGSTK